MQEKENVLSSDSVRKSIMEIAASMFNIDTEDADAFEEMEIEFDPKCDTMDLVELVMSMEDEFGIIIHDEEAEELETFGDCVELAWSKIMSEDDNISDGE